MFSIFSFIIPILHKYCTGVARRRQAAGAAAYRLFGRSLAGRPRAGPQSAGPDCQSSSVAQSVWIGRHCECDVILLLFV